MSVQSMTSRSAFASAPPAQAVEIKGLTKFYGNNGQSQPALEAPDRIVFHYKPSRAQVGEVLAAVATAELAIRDVSSEETDLEDIFLRLTRSGVAS